MQPASHNGTICYLLDENGYVLYVSADVSYESVVAMMRADQQQATAQTPAQQPMAAGQPPTMASTVTPPMFQVMDELKGGQKLGKFFGNAGFLENRFFHQLFTDEINVYQKLTFVNYQTLCPTLDYVIRVASANRLLNVHVLISDN